MNFLAIVKLKDLLGNARCRDTPLQFWGSETFLEILKFGNSGKTIREKTFLDNFELEMDILKMLIPRVTQEYNQLEELRLVPKSFLKLNRTNKILVLISSQVRMGSSQLRSKI